jgi:translation initiation factor 2 beta subunit (eIF-2beta)/eIF-5
MADLENLVKELLELADSMKLTVGESTEIRREIGRIDNIQNKLNIIKNAFQEALDGERFNKGFLGAVSFLGALAGIFIPGGFLVDVLFTAGSGLLAEKLGDPDKETSLADVIENVEGLIEWGNDLKDIAENILTDSQLLIKLEWERKSKSIPDEVRQIDEALRIHLDFDEEQSLRQQVQQIKVAQEQLKQVQPKLDSIVQNLERNVETLDLIKAFISYFGESVFAIEWSNEEDGFIISYEGQTTTTKRIIFNECVSLKEKANALIDRANRLRGQAEQSLKQLEKERRHKEQKKPSPKQSERSTQTGKSLNSIDRNISSEQRRGGKSGWILILSTLTLGSLGLIGWKTNFQLSQVQQTIATFEIPLSIGEQKTNAEASPTLTPTPQPDPTATNLAAAQKLAMEAAVMTQNPPHPLENWQQVQGKWEESIKLLEAIPDSSPVATQAQEKLTVYRTNYQAISNRIVTEQKAATNLESAQKLAWEAAVMVNNPPHPQEVWQNAQSKLQQAINLLNAIPQGTFVEAKAKEKLADYQNNYTVISNRIKTESP